jgi:hypothetical protein
VIGLVPLGRELIGRGDDQAVVLEGDRLGGFEPGTDHLVRKLATDLIEDALPEFFGGLLLHEASGRVGRWQGRPIVGLGCGKVNLDRNGGSPLGLRAHLGRFDP